MVESPAKFEKKYLTIATDTIRRRIKFYVERCRSQFYSNKVYEFIYGLDRYILKWPWSSRRNAEGFRKGREKIKGLPQTQRWQIISIW